MSKALGWLIAGLMQVVIVQNQGTGADPEPDRPKIHYGRVELKYRVRQLFASVRVKLPPGAFSEQPVVVVSESGSAGTLVLVKAEHFEKDSFLITGARHTPGGNKGYTASIGWIAIGKP